MQHFFSNILHEIESQINTINSEYDAMQKRAEASTMVVSRAYKKLKGFVEKHKFKNKSDEIRYFKTMKPRIFSKLIYYSKVYHIETKKPQGSQEIRKRYLLNELDKITRYFESNIDFIRYYRSGTDYLDHVYFVRDNVDFRHSSDSFVMELDHRHTTNFDLKVSKIMANDLLQVYLHDEIKSLEQPDREKTKLIPVYNHSWTESKTALTELIYALHTQGAINYGKSDIKEIARYFEQVFNIDLGDYYRTFLEIRNRKNGKAKFLDSLSDTLKKRIEQHDER